MHEHHTETEQLGDLLALLETIRSKSPASNTAYIAVERFSKALAEQSTITAEVFEALQTVIEYNTRCVTDYFTQQTLITDATHGIELLTEATDAST